MGTSGAPLLLVFGILFVVCGTWFREFYPYQLITAPTVKLHGEHRGHALFRGFGLVLLACGVLVVGLSWLPA